MHSSNNFMAAEKTALSKITKQENLKKKSNDTCYSQKLGQQFLYKMIQRILVIDLNFYKNSKILQIQGAVSQSVFTLMKTNLDINEYKCTKIYFYDIHTLLP